jgi:hypothetical protein
MPTTKIPGTAIDLHELRLDKDGRVLDDVTLPSSTKQVFVFSHGWLNDANEARNLYGGFFRNFERIANKRFNLTGVEPFAVVGVFWPAKKFNEGLAVFGDGDSSGAASVERRAEGEAKVISKLEEMKDLFASDAERKLLDEAIALVGELNDKATARAEFVEKIRSLLDPSAADREDASTIFFASEPDELMESLKLKIKSSPPEERTEEDAATAALPAGPATLALDDVVAAENLLPGFFNSALNLLNYTTYFEMKTRAGTIGKNGVASFLDRLPPSIEAIHLIGHSFGGRVVTAAAANSTTPRIRSMTLLQAAFSHNGFSKKRDGFFRSVVEQKRVRGPILITHSILDRAVGIAYPLASRINQDDRLALGDKNDRFGAIGRNGAQEMEVKEVDDEETKLRPATDPEPYQFKQPVIYNLNGDTLITGHGDVTNEAIVSAVLSAVAPLKS